MNLTKKQDNKNSNENGEVDICVWCQGIEQSWLEQFSPTTNNVKIYIYSTGLDPIVDTFLQPITLHIS